MASCKNNPACEADCLRPAKAPVTPTPPKVPGIDISVNTNCSGGSGCQTCIDGIMADPEADLGEITYTFDEETGGRTYQIGTKYNEFPDNFARITVKDGLSSFVQWTDNCVHLNFTGGDFEYVTYKGTIGNITVPAQVVPYDKGWYLYIDSPRKRVGRSAYLQSIIDNPDFYIFGYMGEDDVDGVPVPAVFIDGYGWYPCPQAEIPGCDVCISDIVADENSDILTVSYETDEETGERLYNIHVENYPDNFAIVQISEGLSKFISWTESGSSIHFAGGTFNYVTIGGKPGSVTIPAQVAPFGAGYWLYVNERTNRVGRSLDLSNVLGSPDTVIFGYMGKDDVEDSITGETSNAVWLFGYGWFPYKEDVKHSKIAQINDFTSTPPISWQTQLGQRMLYLTAGTYRVATWDGVYAGDYVIQNSGYQEFSAGTYACVNVITKQGIFYESDLDVIANTAGLYVIGYFNYVGGQQNIYLYGFGNYTDIPINAGTGTATVIGVPSTFSVSWASATSFTLPAGGYVFIENATGIRRAISLASAASLTYDFSSVLYFTPGTNTINIAPSASIPIGAVLIGSMNNVGGTATVFLNGLGAFPYEGGAS